MVLRNHAQHETTQLVGKDSTQKSRLLQGFNYILTNTSAKRLARLPKNGHTSTQTYTTRHTIHLKHVQRQHSSFQVVIHRHPKRRRRRTAAHGLHAVKLVLGVTHAASLLAVQPDHRLEQLRRESKALGLGAKLA